MKLAFIFGPWSFAGRPPLNFANIYRDHRGLTGSELCAIRPAVELAKSGHTVELFTEADPCTWQGVRVRPMSEVHRDEYDAAVSVNFPDYLRSVQAPVRACWHLLGDVRYAKPGLDDAVTLWIACSEGHRGMLVREHTLLGGSKPEPWTPDLAKVVTIGLGCDPERYQQGIKRPGFCVYTSSPDRGLHWLLQEWPAIRSAAPHATLQVFYRFSPWVALVGELQGEQGRRARYIREALQRLRPHGVTLRDAVSQDHLALQLSRAECLAYPCDPMQPTETFGCAVLEGMAARACPVITNADAFGALYGGSALMVERERPDWVRRWRELVIQALRDARFREEANDRGYEFAKQRTWRRVADELEGVLKCQLDPSLRTNEQMGKYGEMFPPGTTHRVAKMNLSALGRTGAT